jgi:DNA-binding NarL/FixJ family response regulator
VTVSLVLADDHKIFREGLKALLEREQGFTVVGETDDGTTAVELVLSLLPDVAIIDIRMPDVNGIEATRRIASATGQTRIILLSMHTGADYVSEALKAGARGFLSKACTSSELVNAIRSVVSGEHYLSPTISTTLVDLISTPLYQPPPAVENGLSRRENQVLQLLAEGLNTKEAAARLEISAKTVETYRLNLMKKLRITSVANLVRYAIRERLVDVP